jgi:hypothetical protein
MIKILGRLGGAQIGRIQARSAEHERRSGAGGEEGEKKKWKEISLEGGDEGGQGPEMEKGGGGWWELAPSVEASVWLRSGHCRVGPDIHLK